MAESGHYQSISVSIEINAKYRGLMGMWFYTNTILLKTKLICSMGSSIIPFHAVFFVFQNRFLWCTETKGKTYIQENKHDHLRVAYCILRSQNNQSIQAATR